VVDDEGIEPTTSNELEEDLGQEEEKNCVEDSDID